MMQPCASVAKLRGGGSILMHGLKAKEVSGSPPPRIVIGRLLSAAAEDQVPLCQRTQSKALRHLADAHKSPQCDEELSRERHDHDLAHGSAGIRGSGLYHLTKALSFWNSRKRHASSIIP
jgi:hypothetical protein